MQEKAFFADKLQHVVDSWAVAKDKIVSHVITQYKETAVSFRTQRLQKIQKVTNILGEFGTSIYSCG
jgi:CRISPR/Cas system CMR subunit Cmr4 (Cas7 group RAMP superfamily)